MDVCLSHAHLSLLLVATDAMLYRVFHNGFITNTLPPGMTLCTRVSSMHSVAIHSAPSDCGSHQELLSLWCLMNLNGAIIVTGTPAMSKRAKILAALIKPFRSLNCTRSDFLQVPNLLNLLSTEYFTSTLPVCKASDTSFCSFLGAGLGFTNPTAKLNVPGFFNWLK